MGATDACVSRLESRRRERRERHGFVSTSARVRLTVPSRSWSGRRERPVAVEARSRSPTKRRAFDRRRGGFQNIGDDCIDRAERPYSGRGDGARSSFSRRGAWRAGLARTYLGDDGALRLDAGGHLETAWPAGTDRGGKVSLSRGRRDSISLGKAGSRAPRKAPRRGRCERRLDARRPRDAVPGSEDTLASVACAGNGPMAASRRATRDARVSKTPRFGPEGVLVISR